MRDTGFFFFVYFKTLIVWKWNNYKNTATKVDLMTMDILEKNEGLILGFMESLADEISTDGQDPREKILYIAKNASIMYAEHVGADEKSFDYIFPLVLMLVQMYVHMVYFDTHATSNIQPSPRVFEDLN